MLELAVGAMNKKPVTNSAHGSNPSFKWDAPPLSSTLAVMSEPLPLPELLNERHRWVEWVSSEHRNVEQPDDLIGWRLTWEYLLLAT
jgi:hypothetical protein